MVAGLISFRLSGMRPAQSRPRETRNDSERTKCPAVGSGEPINGRRMRERQVASQSGRGRFRKSAGASIMAADAMPNRRSGLKRMNGTIP
jgi:hypothetical protein